MTDLTPALTAEDWERPSTREVIEAMREQNHLPRTIALCNHALPADSPHKITWADVDECIAAANEQDGYWGAGHGDSLAQLASRLASLLPPRVAEGEQ